MLASRLHAAGPPTIQPREELGGLVKRMRKRGARSIIVTTPKGELLGIVDRSNAERFLAEAAGRLTSRDASKG